MSKVDAIGTYIGTIKGTALGETKKSKYPQAVLDLTAVQKYIESAADIEHFKKAGMDIDGPQYVDWSGYDESITAYLVLFKSTEEFSSNTALMNYDQLKKATSWDGTSFDDLTDGSLVGKEILFRVEENTYDGKTSLQVSWIDNKDASPERQLKSVDTDTLKSLNAKLKFKKVIAPAKPVAAKDVVPIKKVKTPPTLVKETLTGLPAECTQLEAWEYLNQPEQKKGHEDSVIEGAWIAAMGEVTDDTKRPDDKFTPADWAKVRDTVIKDLA